MRIVSKTLDRTFNQIDEWTYSANCLKRHLATRGAILIVIPLELLTALMHLIRLPTLLLIEMPIKLSVQVMRLWGRHTCLKQCDHHLGGPKQFGQTLSKLGKHILGLISDLLFGLFFSAKLNTHIHRKYKLISSNTLYQTIPSFDQTQPFLVDSFDE